MNWVIFINFRISFLFLKCRIRLEGNLSGVDTLSTFVVNAFITETLAKIYKEQGHYDKAIDAFEKLILKFPEKSTLFASQISDINKIK